MRKSTAFFTPEVLTLLTRAGWYEGRQAQGQFAVPSDVYYPAQIEELLQEFGGLLILSTGAGLTLARNSIRFDPSYAEREQRGGHSYLLFRFTAVHPLPAGPYSSGVTPAVYRLGGHDVYGWGLLVSGG